MSRFSSIGYVGVVIGLAAGLAAAILVFIALVLVDAQVQGASFARTGVQAIGTPVNGG